MPPRTPLAAHAAALSRRYGSRVAAEPEGPPVIIPTGSLTADRVLGEGGWRQSRIHEIVGPPDAGKSTLMINSAREQQAADPERAVAYIDIEGTFDYDWAHANGLATSPDRWMHLYPDDSEDASDMARDCCRQGIYSCVIVDSVGGMQSRKAMEKDAEDQLPGKNAQVITRMVQHLASLARQHRVTVLLVNQYRATIGTMGGDVSAGPKALQHATTSKVIMTRGHEKPRTLVMDDGEEIVVATQSRVRLARSKLVPHGRSGEFWIVSQPTAAMGSPGIWAADEYAALGISRGAIVPDKGSWYVFPTGERANGRNAVALALQENPSLMAAVRERVLASPDRTGGTSGS